MEHFYCVTQQLYKKINSIVHNKLSQAFSLILSCLPIFSKVTVWVYNSYNDEDVLKVRTDCVRRKWLTAGLLEYDCDYIIANMPLP